MLIHDRKTRSSSKELMELIKDRPQFSTEKVYYFLEYQLENRSYQSIYHELSVFFQLINSFYYSFLSDKQSVHQINLFNLIVIQRK